MRKCTLIVNGLIAVVLVFVFTLVFHRMTQFENALASMLSSGIEGQPSDLNPSADAMSSIKGGIKDLIVTIGIDRGLIILAAVILAALFIINIFVIAKGRCFRASE